MSNIFDDEINDKIKSEAELPKCIKDYLPVATQIQLIRKALGLTQQQLAQKTGTTQEAIARLESGQIEPKLSTLNKIAAALESKVHILITPRKKIKKLLDEKAAEKATELITLAAGSSALEDQNPQSKTQKRQLKAIKNKLISKK